MTVGLLTVTTLSACSSKPTALTNPDDQKALIKTASEKLQGNKYKMSGDFKMTQDGQEYTMNLTIAIDGDNNQMIWKYGEAEMHIISIGKTSYLSEDGEKWYNVGETQESNGLTSTDDFTAFLDDVDNGKYEYQGLEDCDGQSCHVYKVTEAEETSYLYINAKTSELVKMRFVGTDPATGSGEFAVTTDVSISAPAGAEVLSEEEAATKGMEIMFGFFAKIVPQQ